MAFTLPQPLVNTCRKSDRGSEWLARLPDAIERLRQQWALTLEPPFDGDEVSCAWVAPAVMADGKPAVLKIGMPHMEAEHEMEGLRFWDGDAAVRLLDADVATGAMLLERCDPGSVLRSLPEIDQDVVIAGLLRRLWRVPPTPNCFRPLSEMIASWRDETLASASQWADAGLVRAGLQLFAGLLETTPDHVLLHTDLHAGNVLRARREPWLAIDPKPFIGDPAYDATQHLFNCEERLYSHPKSTTRRFADLLDVSHERVCLWTLARAAAEPRDNWRANQLTTVARKLAV